MTVPAQSELFNSSTANGVTTSFPYTFMILSADDIVVMKDGVIQTAGFSITGVGSTSGGAVVFSVAPANGVIVNRYLDVSLERATDYQQFGDWNADAVNADMDRIVLGMQSLDRKVERAIKLPANTAGDQVLSETAAERAGMVVGFDSAGDPALLSAADINVALVTTFAATLLDDSNAATARETLGLGAQAMGLGEVLMYATAPSVWTLLDENRVPIDISASTTDGLQEAIDYAYANGLNIRVLGGMSTGVPEADYGIIYCSTQVVWPPMRGCTIDLQGVIIAFTSAVTGDGMVFDSMQEVDFRLVGEITYQGNGDAVSFAPHSALPVDTTIGIGASRIYIGAIACPGGSPDSCVHFDTTNGSIISGHYEFEELNGAAAVGSPPKADYGIKVSIPSASYAFNFNTIRANAIHEVIVAGVQAGLSATHADNLASNSYLIGQIQTNGTDAVGFNTWGDSDADLSIGLIQAIGGNLKWGVYLQTSAENNTISVGSILGATTAAVADLGTNNAVAYNGTYSWPVETRIAPTLAGTWANLGAGQPDVTYWKDPFGVVHLEGAVTSGGADTIFTLPTGYRPAAAQLFPVVANSVFSYVQIATTGVVSCPAHTAVTLNGISFRT